jgi:hypothetical protein
MDGDDGERAHGKQLRLPVLQGAVPEVLRGSRSPPKPVSSGDRRPGMIEEVSLRLLYIILSQLLSWMTLLPYASSSKDIELLVLRHEDAVLRSTKPKTSPGRGRRGPVRRADPTPACAVARASPGHSGYGPAVAPAAGHQEMDVPEPLRSPTCRPDDSRADRTDGRRERDLGATSASKANCSSSATALAHPRTTLVFSPAGTAAGPARP